MLSPRAVRFALLELAECGRVHVMEADAALQIAAAWPGETVLGHASSFWTIQARAPSAPPPRRHPAAAP